MASTALRSDPQGGLSVAEIITLLGTRRAQRRWIDGHDNVSRVVPKRVSARPSRADTADAAPQGYRILVSYPQLLTRNRQIAACRDIATPVDITGVATGADTP